MAMFKNKVQISLCLVAVLPLTGCMIPSQLMVSQATDSAMAMSGLRGSAVDAEEFSKKVITLKVGSATKEECISLLGNPASTMSDYGIVSISYYLSNTGNMIPSMASLSFKNNILWKVDVHKTSFNGSGVDMSNIYSQGSR